MIVRVISANVNGIRSATTKGFYEWLLAQQADIVCLQEIRAHYAQLTEKITHLPGYHGFFYDAQRKGYSGVALFSKKPPKKVQLGLGWPAADDEGRYLQADYDGISIASLYMPSGSSGEERQQAKFDFLARFFPVLEKLRDSGREFIICGDWNIAHKPIDLKNWRANQKNSGFLPEERAWLDQVFDGLGWVDAFRVVNPHADQYTWWSNRGRARENNVGWRIDYQVVSPGLAQHIKAASIFKDQWFSDHAPLIMDYDVVIM